MTIQNLIDLLKSGELKNLAVGKDNATVLGFINLALIELYKRFPLVVNEHIITLEEGVTIYNMPEDFMWIVTAYGEVDEFEDKVFNQIPINEEDNPESLNTIGWTQVQIPIVAEGAYISIIYAAAPQYYTIDDLEEKLPVPQQMLEPLIDYVAYKAFKTIPNAGQAEATSYYQLFENSCNRIEQRGMFSSDDMDMLARDLKGFV